MAVRFLAGFSGGAEPPCSRLEAFRMCTVCSKALQTGKTIAYLIFPNLIFVEQVSGSITVAYLFKAFCRILTCASEGAQGCAGHDIASISFGNRCECLPVLVRIIS